MTRFTTKEDLLTYRERLGPLDEPGRIRVMVGMSTCGRASGAEDAYMIAKNATKDLGLDDRVDVIKTGCVGLCYSEPTVEVKIPDHDTVTLECVTPARMHEIIESLADGAVDGHPYAMGMGVYALQQRIALRNCGNIDPENIDCYIRVGGYEQLAVALLDKSPKEIIGVIKASGLRGRGGGGFPTGLKWEYALNANAGEQKYIVCNADEGDPGAFMDRSILEGDPHSIIEAMCICGYAIGADRGYIYVRAEYPLAIHHLRRALDQARELGLLGENIFGSGFDFDLSIRYGAGAFVCGEETALIHSIEGLRGEPTVKPPFPAESGLWGRTTNVNNVETFANIVPILEQGADWFRSIGTKNSPGTKVFALAGDIRHVGLVEVPMGTTLRQIVYELGGGTPSGQPVGAVQTGGPSGGCIPAELFDTPIDYDSLTELGSMMGSGGMIVMEEGTSMVGIARFYMQFMCDESCGKCTPCRIGTKRMLELLDRLLEGRGSSEDIEQLKRLGRDIKAGALCGLGQTAPNPVLSTLRYYPEQYEDLAAGIRTETVYAIIEENCVGCTACANKCPVSCIEGETKQPHRIRTEDCIRCGVCLQTCRFNAVEQRTVKIRPAERS